MTSQIVTRQESGLSNPQTLIDAARGLAKASKAVNTTKAYSSDQADFRAWAELRGAGCLPADVETVVLYITDLALRNFKTSTISRRIVAISKAHQAAGLPNPTQAQAVRSVIAGIRRTLGTAKEGKSPILTDHLRAWIIQVLPSSPKWRALADARDKALVLVGYAGDMRRSELTALDFEDIEFVSQGMIVTLKRSKTDQEGAGTQKAIMFGAFDATCPVKALMTWISLAGITTGALFLRIRKGRLTSDRLESKTVGLIVKALAKSIGLDPADYGAHSLRAGGITQAALNGASEADNMRQSGHKSTDVFRGYVRISDLFKRNVSGLLGL